MNTGIYRGTNTVIPMAAIAFAMKHKTVEGKWGVFLKVSSGDKILAAEFATEAEADGKLEEFGEDLREFYDTRGQG